MLTGGSGLPEVRRRTLPTRGWMIVVTMVATTVVMPAPRAVPAVPTMTTVAGGVGWGAATNVGQSPLAIGIFGDRVLEVDGPSTARELPPLDASYPAVVRAIDPEPDRNRWSPETAWGVSAATVAPLSVPPWGPLTQ